MEHTSPAHWQHSADIDLWGFDAVSAPSCQSVELPSSFDGSWHKHIDESLANKEEYTCSGRDEQYRGLADSAEGPILTHALFRKG